jgi:hypothetical protein
LAKIDQTALMKACDIKGTQEKLCSDARKGHLGTWLETST